LPFIFDFHPLVQLIILQNEYTSALNIFTVILEGHHLYKFTQFIIIYYKNITS